MVKVAIVGSREFNDYELLTERMDFLNSDGNIEAVICGCARGADSLGEKWAKERGIEVIRMPAEWDKYGKSAGYKRNDEMAVAADAVVAFWDGESRGTAHMIRTASALKLDVRIVRY